MKTTYLGGNRPFATTNWQVIPRTRVGKILPDDSIYPAGSVVAISGLGNLSAEEGGVDSSDNITLRLFLERYFTLSLSRAQYQLLCWRVRKWRFEFSAALDSFVGDDDVVITRDFDRTFEFLKSQPETTPATSYDLAANERQVLEFPTVNYPSSVPAVLSALSGLRGRGIRSSVADASEPYELAEINPAEVGRVNNNVQRGIFAPEFPFALWDEDTDLISVACPLSVVMQDDTPEDPGTGPEATVSAFWNAYRPSSLPPPDGPVGYITFDFGDAGEAVLAMYGANTGSFSGSFTPSKWWAFSTSAGDPVYDEDTGVPLNDPFA